MCSRLIRRAAIRNSIRRVGSDIASGTERREAARGPGCYADALLTSLPTQGSVLARVSNAVARQILDEVPTLSSTAHAVGMPARTLQRHLAAEGATHFGIVDGVQRDLALKHLGNASIHITEIAYALHFTDPTAFHRAFRRCTSLSPLQYRRLCSLFEDARLRLARVSGALKVKNKSLS